MTRVLFSLLTVLVLVSSGCATTMNCLYTQKPYGGIVIDGKAIGKGCTPSNPGDVIVGVGAIVDTPLSLVGDTLTVPFILYHKNLDSKSKYDDPEPSPQAKENNQ